jgi:hypothetical protein
VRRVLACVDPDALDLAIGRWLADQDQPRPFPPPPRRRRAVAVDGKTLRGARHGPDGRQVQLLAAMDHTTRAVLAQRQVNGAPGEVPGFQPLLAGLDLAATVVTADALHTHADTAEFLVSSKQAHHLFTVRPSSPPCWTARPPALAQRPRAGPHPRPRPRPHRVAHPQGGLGPPLPVPARRPGRPGHPQDPRPARRRPAVAHRDRLRDHQPHLRPALPGSPTCCVGTGRSRTACTTSAT